MKYIIPTLVLAILLLLFACQEVPPLLAPSPFLNDDSTDCVGSIPTFPFNVDSVRKIFAEKVHYHNYEKCLDEIFNFDTLDRSKTKIFVDKSEFRLTIIYGGEILKSYPVVLGNNPRDDKLQQGDGRTPEGYFKIQAKYPHAEWSKFMWVNYPTKDSYRKHEQAKKDKKIADFVDIGGEIGIHGVPEGMDFWIDWDFNWTAGCVSLSNPDVNELYKFVKAGTPIMIQR